MVLDDASLLYLFSQLPGETVAACSQVCRAWHAVSTSEVLWQRKCLELEPHPHLRRDDLLPAFGGSHRAYFAWRWPLLNRRPLGRLLIEGDLEGREIVTAPIVDSLVRGAAGMGSSGGEGAASHQAGLKQGTGTHGVAAAAAVARAALAGMAVVYVEGEVMVQQATWSPAGSLLAFTEMRANQSGHGALVESRVVVADGRTGQHLGSWVLSSPMPPFYYMWAACGTRLLFLSNWEGGVVALRSLDIAFALVPPGVRATLGVTRDVLLCTARPLFLDISPTSTRLLWHGSCRRFGLADAATHTAEDGAEDDCFFENAQLCPSQAPQWLIDSAGADWLLMPVVRSQPTGPGPAGSLLLAPLAVVSEALETEGSRLSPSLLLSLGRQVADFASPRDLSFAATPDASHVAICDRGALHIWRAETGARFQVFPLPAQQHLAPMPSASSGGDGGSGRREDFWHTGAVQALQWSPDGRRLLFLVRRSGGGMPMVALSKRPHYRWMVYDVCCGGQGDDDGRLGSVTQCLPFNPTLEFLDRYLPFFDQYSRSLRLWSPDSCAFCFCARGQPAVGEVSEEPSVHVQPVPRLGPAAADAASGSGDVGATLALAEAPLPVRVAHGTFASWSWH
ncbi:hypothetical protein ABPG77_006500 [Micractinium sp. CCAP 211/92]